MKFLMAQRWQGPGGYGAVLRLALPLIVSTSAHTVQLFVDRVFLSGVSPTAMSAATQAGILNFNFVALFMGTVMYVNTFVAQYTGAQRPERLGPALWQGIYLALGGGVLIGLLIPAAAPLCRSLGHGPELQAMETIYFQYMCISALPVLIATTISAFFTGRGKTMVVMYVNLAAMLVNIVLDYGLIFGHLGLPEMGFRGAALATVISAYFSALIFIWLFFLPQHRRRFRTLSGWRFESDLFRRLIRYGLPSGIQFTLDVLPFTLFIMFIGRIDEYALHATVLAFQINTLAFMPMIGFGMAVTTLVGQALGADDPPLAQRTTWSAAVMTFAYMILIATGFVLLPDLFLAAFTHQMDPERFALIEPIVKGLLLYVGFYCLFDTGNIIFSATLKGAGDTRFVMFTSIGLNWIILVIPSYLAYKCGWSYHVPWAFATAYVCILAVVFYLRFQTGKWKLMRVIESAHAAIATHVPDVPTIEVDSPQASLPARGDREETESLDVDRQDRC